jgi:hypothetical protein
VQHRDEISGMEGFEKKEGKDWNGDQAPGMYSPMSDGREMKRKWSRQAHEVNGFGVNNPRSKVKPGTCDSTNQWVHARYN